MADRASKSPAPGRVPFSREQGKAARGGWFVSLGTKLALAMVVVVTLVSAVVFFEVSEREHESLLRAKTAAATAVADLFSLSVAAPLDFGDADAVRAELVNLKANRDVVYAGAWLAGARDPTAEISSGGSMGERPSAPATDDATLIASADAVEVTRPVRNVQNKRVGTTLIRFSLASENAAFAATRSRLFWMCLAMASVTLGLLVLVARQQIMTPLAVLLAAVRKVERGEDGADVKVRANDEIGRLARGFNEMRSAIVDREERLATANRSMQELLDNMRQAIVVFGPDGASVGAGSRAAQALFGQDVEGSGIVQLLHPSADPTDPEALAFAEWVDLAFAAPANRWSDVAELAPQEVVLHAGQPNERALVLEFRPIVTADDATATAARIMLLATDETEKRRLVREAQSKGEEHEREMAAVRQLLVGRGDAFVAFLERGRERLARCEELLAQSGGEPRGGALDEMLQHAHTVKGDARAFDLADLASAMSTLEQQLRSARTNLGALRAAAGADERSAKNSTREALTHGLTGASAMFDRAAKLFVQVSPLGESALDRVTVRRSDVQRLVELAQGRGDAIAEVASRLAARPFSESASILAEKVPTWAEAIGKRARMMIEGGDVLVPPGLARALGGVLGHLVRNSVAHGVELPAEREAAGKPLVGDLLLRCEAGAKGPTITLDDDGAGIAAEAILARAKSAGIGAGMTAEELIFEPNFTMRADLITDAAGLGVGLAAVRADLAEAGYVISAQRRPVQGTRFVISPRGDP